MDQPTIYSETVREKVGAFGVWRLAFGARRSAFGARRSAFGVPGTQRVVVRTKRSKPERQICRKNNTVGGRSFSPYRFPARVNRRRC
jgi:hypothetical protein